MTGLAATLNRRGRRCPLVGGGATAPAVWTSPAMLIVGDVVGPWVEPGDGCGPRPHRAAG